ncbi:alpha/beta fold hydrolase [Roseomonas gilardii subsp. gilardii]|uniref:alpha/beta fold hydrolase n=1 Tax=Roseomonas gilardii TaxID=257708 RepID=UPI001FF8FB2A|nr:alpha/beta fold hydrolase [Roseomonas gilardii]UPG71406.1 alpha/beta fold hydrolase [Roseomonas gilardii subsp. gilardii]
MPERRQVARIAGLGAPVLLSWALLSWALPGTVRAADGPAAQEKDWIARDFRFSNGRTMTEMRVHYATVGDPLGEPVLVLHGTGGSGTGLLSPVFAGELFGPGQALDARKYFVILPDAIGAGKSSKPSDGLKADFPSYDYDDMVRAQYRLLTEGMGIRHLRLVIGNSMGGMESWVWGITHPGFMDALVPMASQPTPMAGRNWMLRRMLIETVRADPAYQGGNYTAQPPSLRMANTFFDIATNGGTLNLQARGATHAGADRYVDERLALPAPRDANDFLYQWNASANYDPSGKLETIEAPVLAINSADDERNPPETGVMAEAMKKVRNGRVFLIPASTETRGHGTTGMAKFWAAELKAFLEQVPRRAP